MSVLVVVAFGVVRPQPSPFTLSRLTRVGDPDTEAGPIKREVSPPPPSKLVTNWSVGRFSVESPLLTGRAERHEENPKVTDDPLHQEPRSPRPCLRRHAYSSTPDRLRRPGGSNLSRKLPLLRNCERFPSPTTDTPRSSAGLLPPSYTRPPLIVIPRSVPALNILTFS